jgi:hypothetical protein
MHTSSVYCWDNNGTRDCIDNHCRVMPIRCSQPQAAAPVFVTTGTDALQEARVRFAHEDRHHLGDSWLAPTVLQAHMGDLEPTQGGAGSQ